jgi:hypothetical protein
MPDYAVAEVVRGGPAAPTTAVATEVRRVRREAQARYSEVDLLVATLRDHVRDLRRERDRLLAELTRTQEAARLARTAWLARGLKPSREAT